VSDRDDALRRDLGWTGPEETDYEPPVEKPKFTRAAPPVPSRPPVDPTPPSRPAPPSAATPSDPPSTPEPSQPIPAREPERPSGATRPVSPPRFGPPPGTPRDTGPVGAPIRPDNPQQQWGQQPPWPGQQPPPRPPRAAAPPNTGQAPPNTGQLPYGTWSGTSYGPDPRMAPPAPTGSYADRIRADELVPSRRVPPTTGWRKALYRATFGLVNVGQSADELRQAELEARIKAVLRGHYKVGVMGKGGVGKTTMSASIGSIFAELRQEDRVVAIDADTSFGKLGSRVDPKAMGSYWELASDQHLETFADVRSRVGNNAAGLFVLAGEASPARRRVLDPAIYREATSRLDRYFSISIIDCSSTMDSPVTQEVLRDLDALIVVSSPWVDGAATAGQTMDWLANRGLTSLLRRTVVVLNDSDGHADKRTRGILANQFAGQGQVVVEVPFDGHLRPGGVIAGTTELAPATRRKFIEIAAALAEHFPPPDEHGRERR
jgi:MinD-like ATPase involved in chromosome partitioning or flagellar assembly